MDPQVYQKLAERTECDQEAAASRLSDPFAARVNHAAVGLAGDAGELLAAVERWIYYGRELDRMNVVEEMGDCLWYLAQMCNALGVRMGGVMTANIAKLQERYPEKFESLLAEEGNRDRKAEMNAVNASLDTVSNMPVRDPYLDVFCKSCGPDERCTEGDGTDSTLKEACSGHLCPRCKGPVSDEVVKRLWYGREGGCPACGADFALNINHDGSKLGKFVVVEK